MGLGSEVEQVIESAGCTDWRAELARELVAAWSDGPNAALAKEIRTVVGQIEADVSEPGASKADELRARRAKRVAKTKAG